MGCRFPEFFEPEKPDELQVVINQDDLIEMEVRAFPLSWFITEILNRTLAMIFETYRA